MAHHKNTGKYNEGKQFAKQLQKARNNIDEYANEIEDPQERQDYLDLIEVARAELRRMDRARARRTHVLAGVGEPSKH